MVSHMLKILSHHFLFTSRGVTTTRTADGLDPCDFWGMTSKGNQIDNGIIDLQTKNECISSSYK